MRRDGRVRSAAPAGLCNLPQRPPSFVCAYATDVVAGDTRSSEEWARQLWDGAPTLLRWFMTEGWRRVLRLRLERRRSPDHILGWSVTERLPERTVCRAQSPLLTAFNIFVRRDGEFVWSTYVFYDRPLARLIWRPVSLLHRPIVRFSLARAQRQS